MAGGFWRGYIYFLVVMLALAAGSIVVIATFLDSFTWCSSRIVREFPSQPGSSKAAVVGVTGCGATGPDTTFVMIRRPDRKFDIAGDNVFFAVGGINDIEVVWEGQFLQGFFGYSNNLTVIYRRPEINYKERILRQATVWDTDRISYRESLGIRISSDLRALHKKN